MYITNYTSMVMAISIPESIMGQFAGNPKTLVFNFIYLVDILYLEEKPSLLFTFSQQQAPLAPSSPAPSAASGSRPSAPWKTFGLARYEWLGR